MEEREQKKILVNPNFILAKEEEQVKPKVHFNPAFLQKCAAAAAQKKNVSSSHSSTSATVQNYEHSRGQVYTHRQINTDKFNHSPYKFSAKPQNLKSKLLYEKPNAWQHRYSKQNVYSHKSVHLPVPQQPAVVKTTGSVVKPSPAYSWTSQSFGTKPSPSSPSKTALQNNVQTHSGALSKSSTLVSHSGSVVPSKIYPSERSKVSHPHVRSKYVMSVQNSKKVNNFQVMPSVNAVKTYPSVNVSNQSLLEKKTVEITSRKSSATDRGFQNKESSSILVNPKFLHKLSAKASASTPGDVKQDQGSSPLKTLSTRKEEISAPVHELKETRDIHKKVLDGSEKRKYSIVSRTKLVRQNSTTKSKPKCVRMMGGIKSPKTQRPVIVYVPNTRASGRRRFSVISRTKLIRSNSGGSAGSEKVCGKPKYSYKSKTKLVRNHSNSEPPKAESLKSESERHKKFTILSKTKLVRRRSNSGSFKTKMGKMAVKMAPVYQTSKTIVKRHKLVRNSSSLSRHRWAKASHQDARMRTASMFKVTNNNMRISVNQKLAKGIISKYKINRLKCEPSEAANTKIHSSFSDLRRKFKQSGVSRGRYQTPKKHSDRFINIGGILYKSTKTTLRKQLAKNVPRIPKRPAESCIVVLRGERFHLTAGGRTLKRVRGSVSSLTTRPSLPRVHIGGLTYSRTQTGQYKLTSTHHARALLSSAKQRSITTLMMQRRKKGSLQKRNQFCVFFNRFGRCAKKERGACPFIHDSKRVAVCTRFLKGRCPIKTCPFSHTVDPDKMPVCSHFLRSVCTRDPCPYRHIRVNPAAPICLDFVRGYCQAGSDCKKQHVLVCEEYQKNGKCSRGETCPLSHRKGHRRYAPRTQKQVVDEGPGKKINYTLHRKRKRSESDVLGRVKSKKRSEVSLIKILRVPSLRYFSVVMTDEGKENDDKNDTPEGFDNKGNCASSQSSISQQLPNMLSSSSQVADMQSDEKETACASAPHNTEENSALQNTPMKMELKETRLRILEKVDKLKKSYDSHSSSDLSKVNDEEGILSCRKNVGHSKDAERSGFEDSTKDEPVDEASASTSCSVVQRHPLPKRLPSYIPLTMDETTQDM